MMNTNNCTLTLALSVLLLIIAKLKQLGRIQQNVNMSLKNMPAPTLNGVDNAIDISDPRTYLPIYKEEYGYSWNSNIGKGKQELNFLHIPKTGGSSIEIAAALAGFSWGSCLFRKRSRYSSLVCPPYNYSHKLLYENRKLSKQTTKGACWWHVPIQYLPVNYNFSLNYLSNYTNPYANQDIFVVIRNPYSRAVSEFYFRSEVAGTDQDTAEAMNRFIQNTLKALKGAGKPTPVHRTPAGYFQWDGHCIPQYDFVYLSTPQQLPQPIVKHILHFEHLTEEFDSLMSAYGLNINLTAAGRVHNSANRRPKLSVANLTYETRLLIEEMYEKDFELGGYIMIEKEVKSQFLYLSF